MSITYGYAYAEDPAVREQKEKTLLAAGVAPGNLFIDPQVGAYSKNTEYYRLVDRLKEGDLLYIDTTSDLGAPMLLAKKHWDDIALERNVDIAALSQAGIDTRLAPLSADESSASTAQAISDSLTYPVFMEQELLRQQLIKQRRREGMHAARDRGVHIGRPAAPLPANFAKIKKRYLNNELTAVEAAKACGMSKATFCRKAGPKAQKKNDATKQKNQAKQK